VLPILYLSEVGEILQNVTTIGKKKAIKMPRISREMIKEREAMTLSNFRAGMSIDSANSALETKYGHRMNPYRLRELFDSVNQGNTDEAPTVSPSLALPLPSLPLPIFVPRGSGILDRVVQLDPNSHYQTISELVADIEEGKYS
jgi:hypothetical protein